MKLLEALLKTIPSDPIPIRKIIVGVHWTLVSSKYCGLGSTMTRQDILEGRLIARVVYRPIMLIDDIALNIVVTTEEVNVYFDTNLGIGGSV